MDNPYDEVKMCRELLMYCGMGLNKQTLEKTGAEIKLAAGFFFSQEVIDKVIRQMDGEEEIPEEPQNRGYLEIGDLSIGKYGFSVSFTRVALEMPNGNYRFFIWK